MQLPPPLSILVVRLVRVDQTYDEYDAHTRSVQDAWKSACERLRVCVSDYYKVLLLGRQADGKRVLICEALIADALPYFVEWGDKKRRFLKRAEARVLLADLERQDILDVRSNAR